MSGPVLYAFGVHLHQPVGNFDSVFEQHLADVYQPLLDALREGRALPATFHVSGPLLTWLETNAPTWVDTLGREVAEGRVELLASGFDEPILAALSPEDRLEQIGRMRRALHHRFGVEATGLWLTERVWEPDLAADLVRAGIRYVVLDDRHFLAAGVEREALHLPWRTEAAGQGLTVLPIDERLRYLVPFRPPSEFADHIRTLHQSGLRLALLADDGEKFGGWPGTRAWVYERGWLDQYLRTLEELRGAGVLRMVTCGQAVAELPSAGLVYLPSASYREMEGWALPAPAAQRLAALEKEMGDRLQGPEGALVRGSHWRSFLAKYAESNRMHKKALRLSRLCRERGDPPAARAAIGRAQCNDAYWHGVFGGLYLPFLRAAVWGALAEAEYILRQGEPLTVDVGDLDFDGHEEIGVQSSAFAAVISPWRGGSLEELARFTAGVNLADTLTRRREAYHLATHESGEPQGGSGDGAPSIHDLEKQLALEALPPVDRADRSIFQERLLAGEPDATRLASGAVEAVQDWATEPFVADIEHQADGVTVRLQAEGLAKEYRFRADGTVELTLSWTPAASGTWFITELSLAPVQALSHDADREWRYDIETVAKSEKGLDRTIQGTAVVLGWRGETGSGRVMVPAAA